MIARLLAIFPSIEVAGRLAYWRNPVVHRIGNRIRDRRARRARARAGLAQLVEQGDFADVIAALGDLGVGKGDILIIHASFAALKPFGLSADQVIAELRALIGSDGTLAMPTIPMFRGEPEGMARHSDAAFDVPYDYDVASTRIWTGALARALMKTDDVVRSRCPANPMVAVGPHAEPMMRDNLSAEFLTPSGPGSAWEYCYRHNAKVVALGIDLVHSLTMIHVAEECFPERWRIADWYRPRRYRVNDGDTVNEVIVNERRHGWSQYYAERAFSRDLFRAGVARSSLVAGVAINFCGAKPLVDFLVNHPRPFYPYVFPFGIKASGRRP